VAETWDRLPNERQKAYRAFVMYRDMLADRSLDKVRQKLGRSPSYKRVLEEWSAKHRWQERVKAYDEHLAEKRREAQERAIVEMAERQAREGMTLQAVGMAWVDSLRGPDGKPDKNKIAALTANEAARLVDLGHKIERVARGEPETISETKSKNVDLSDELAERLLKAMEMDVPPDLDAGSGGVRVG